MDGWRNFNLNAVNAEAREGLGILSSLYGPLTVMGAFKGIISDSNRIFSWQNYEDINENK